LIVGCLVAFFVSNECVLAEESNLINGVCGYSHGKTFSSVPTTNLCAQGTPTPSLVDPWGWTCNGINGGSSVNCSANSTINGVCGYSHGKTFSSVPTTNLCAQGTPTPSLVDPWGWTCNGINGGSSVNCSANQIEANTDNNITDGQLKLDKPLSQMSRNELFQVLILLIMNLLGKN